MCTVVHLPDASMRRLHGAGQADLPHRGGGMSAKWDCEQRRLWAGPPFLYGEA